MAAYDTLFELIRMYFISLGYDSGYVSDYFTGNNFSEILSVRLANANVVIRNKADRTSHQTHVAITGEGVSFFYTPMDFSLMDNNTIDRKIIYVCSENIKSLSNEPFKIINSKEFKLNYGIVTVGKRTQKQVQFSKRNRDNSPCLNELRSKLFENDLLVLLKRRRDNSIFCIGIPQSFYLKYIPNYAEQYDANTYLRIPKKNAQ